MKSKLEKQILSTGLLQTAIARESGMTPPLLNHHIKYGKPLKNHKQAVALAIFKLGNKCLAVAKELDEEVE